MATTNTYQQRAQQRKLIYAGVILALFTGALLHREFVVYAQANNMQLREVTKGQVELTSSLLRHTLSGAHGLGVTILWATAIEKMKRHEWNELEILVNSIMRLQPYFITPWRYQGWNLAFNVSVECDSPIDKYYYITRGLNLLANGDRRNQGTPSLEKGFSHIGFPGNPDLRRDIGTYYQMKIGISDDKYTMRCLLDMSCIDPLERRFESAGMSNDAISRDSKLGKKLDKFCHDYPSLTRRIMEQVLKDSPRQFIEFLEMNKDVPSRFDPPRPGDQNCKLRKVEDQFPILPPADNDDWPNPNDRELTSKEAISVYLMSRTWFQYAQKPLPPVESYYDKVMNPRRREIDTSKYRLSRMADVLFRGDPCRAQAFMAETLQQEGWFGESYLLHGGDAVGWQVPDSFLPGVGIVGIDRRFQSADRWRKAYDMYKEFGGETGLYLTPSQVADLEGLARKFRQEHGLGEDQLIQGRSELVESREYKAHHALYLHKFHRGMTNFDVHFYSAEAEKDPMTVVARRTYFEAEKMHSPSLANRFAYFRLTDHANYLWMEVLLKYPRFAQSKTNQEDTYERELKYLSRSAHDYDVLYGTYTDIILVGFELMPPHLPWATFAALATDADKVRPIRPNLVFPGVGAFAVPDRTVAAAVLAERNRRLALGTTALGLLGQSGMGPLLAASEVAAERLPRPVVRLLRPDRRLLDETQLNALIPLRAGKYIRTNIRGPFDMLQYYSSPRTPALKEALFFCAAGTDYTASAGMSGCPLALFGALNPAHHMGIMTSSALGVYTAAPPPPGALPGESWRFLVEPEAVAAIRSRYGLR